MSEKHILSDFSINKNFENLVESHIKESINEGLEIHNLGWATTENEICSKATYINNNNVGVYFTSGFGDVGYYHIVEPQKQVRKMK
jgi:hypothetical protein